MHDVFLIVRDHCLAFFVCKTCASPAVCTVAFCSGQHLSNCLYLHTQGPRLMQCRGTVSHVCLNEHVSTVMFPDGVVQINSLFS